MQATETEALSRAKTVSCLVTAVLCCALMGTRARRSFPGCTRASESNLQTVRCLTAAWFAKRSRVAYWPPCPSHNEMLVQGKISAAYHPRRAS